MWKDILKTDMRKSPYIIEDDYWGQENIRSQKTNVLFQGTQGEVVTEYWTPNLMEAVVYSLFGSKNARQITLFLANRTCIQPYNAP